MSSRVVRLLAVAALLALLIAGCGGSATPEPAAPAATAVPSSPTSVPASPTPLPPTPTPAPASPTPVPPTAFPTEAPTDEPAAPAEAAGMPDPEADPMAALLYASSEENWRSANFTYEMSMSMEAGESAGTEASMMEGLGITATGDGAVEVVDAAAGKANMRMALEMAVMGQTMAVDMVTIDDTAWVRMGEDSPWQKADASATSSSLPYGDPATMLETFKNATEVEYVDDEPLDGVPVHHLRFQMDPGDMDLASMATSMGSTGGAGEEEVEAILQDMTIDVDVWLTAEDMHLHRESMVMTMVMPMPEELEAGGDLRATVEMVMDFSKVNEPVTIEAPEE